MAEVSQITRPALVVLNPADQRDAPRQRAWISRALVSRDGRTGLWARLKDLSASGCRLETGREYAPGEHLWLQLQGMRPLGAEVVWCREGHCGCRFDTPMSAAQQQVVTLPAF